MPPENYRELSPEDYRELPPEDYRGVEYRVVSIDKERGIITLDGIPSGVEYTITLPSGEEAVAVNVSLKMAQVLTKSRKWLAYRYDDGMYQMVKVKENPTPEVVPPEWGEVSP